MNEVEIIQYGHIHGLSLFLNCVEYRTPHLHPEWELIWILDGTLTIRVEDSEYSMEKGSLVLFPPGIVHEFNAKTPDATFLCLQMTPQFLNLSDGVTCTSLFPGEFLKEDEILKAKRMLLEISLSYFKRPSLFQMFCAGECNLYFSEVKMKLLFIIVIYMLRQSVSAVGNASFPAVPDFFTDVFRNLNRL